MKSLYASPLRVYTLLGFLALIGLFSGLNLSISLFPNSTKPVVRARVSYGGITASEFLESEGKTLESSLRSLSTTQIRVESLEATYRKDSVEYTVNFPWEIPGNEALKEVEALIQRSVASKTDEVRRNSYAYTYSENNGFFAASLYSPKRSTQELYKIVKPVLAPELQKVLDANHVEIWNPSQKEIQIQLKPEALTQFQLLPNDIATHILSSKQSYTGGSLKVGDKRLVITYTQPTLKVEDIRKILLLTPKGQTISLSDVAKVELTIPSDKSRSIRTSGAPSVLVYASPKNGGNIKQMSEDILQILKNKKSDLPDDIDYKVLVDPSEFIRSSVTNVIHEVILAALLAVFILFLFIGSFKNVITAAIEIPLSIILAFILMKLNHINLNLISLGGLALSAGMNVDGSVVVMENIFRHFENVKKDLSYQEKLKKIVEAVNEVKLPIIASTIASLVVFTPLIFTAGLTSALLGDLAKAVVFSHGLSAIVALVLVPTIRLQIMNRESNFSIHSPIEKYFSKIEALYEKALRAFLTSKKSQYTLYAGLLLLLGTLLVVIVPKLPKEIIGRPDTDWVFVSVSSQMNTLMRQMETQVEETESSLLEKHSEQVLYTFTQIHSANNANIMLRLKDKHDMQELQKQLEDELTNTTALSYYVAPWNPSELPIPDPESLLIAIKGEDAEKMSDASSEIKEELEQVQLYRSLWTSPNTERSEGVEVTMHPHLVAQFYKTGVPLQSQSLADYTQTVTEGKTVGYFDVEGESTKIVMKYPEDMVSNIEQLGALPLVIQDKIIPLKALAKIEFEKTFNEILRRNQVTQYEIKGRLKIEDKFKTREVEDKARKIVDQWKISKKGNLEVSVDFENPSKEMDEAIQQLLFAIIASLVLILVTMIFQLGSLVNSLLVFVSVPLGLIGVLLSLYVFKSTLSLNSMLGVILLNGIVVANSIILVDFIHRIYKRGIPPTEAALQASRTRLRPILMTSLTTTLGMLPIALGLGEGGKILQPLGIAVSGGLWVSVLLTLFIVPSLQVQYLKVMEKK